MATRPTKSDLADSVQIALDAADTATGVTEEFKIGRGRVGKECRSRWSPYH